MLINAGKYPIEYEIKTNRYMYSDITENEKLYFIIGLAIIIGIAFIAIVIKYKMQGLLASISCIGFISLFLLLIRYTNVLISIEGIGAIIFTIIINIVLNIIILSKVEKLQDIDESVKKAYKEVFNKLISIIIMTIVLCFARWENLSSFGMIMFWGLILIAVYNILVTKTLLKLRESK